MTDHEPFIRAVSADPTCDTARQVYADWLEENDHPHAADYLRTELLLAKLPADSPKASAVRDRLWRAWAAVDPHWLATFTQPRMLLANPTPFPSAWWNFDLGNLREARSTYGEWSYESIPSLPLDKLRGEFQYVDISNVTQRTREVAERYLRGFRGLLNEASDEGVRLPAEFVRFMRNPDLYHTFHSVTDSYFTFPDDYTPIRTDQFREGLFVHFYTDSQGCVLWDLYVHASGAHCVIARDLDYFSPKSPDPDDDQPPYTGPRAWFIAPSFEAFVYRIWIENQVWYLQHADFLRRRGETPPPLTPDIQAYMDHYRKGQGVAGEV